MENLIIIAVLVVVVVIGVLSTKKHFRGEGGCCGGGTYREKKKIKHVAGKKVVRIAGMMCENCEARVERFVNELPGVACRANHKKNEAVVSYETAVSEEQIRAAVDKAGYQVLEIK